MLEEEKYEERAKIKKLSRKDSDLFAEEEVDKYRAKIYQKKKLNLTRYEDEYDYDYDDYRYKDITFKDQESILSKLSESLRKDIGTPTRIKIYKCVVWKNPDPTLDEDTIKKMLHRSGSQLFNRGGFIVKLPQNKNK